MSEFSISLAQEFVESNDPFPVDFDLAWQWLGYSRKDVAKRAFDKAQFSENVDYRLSRRVAENPLGGRPTETITLSIECFKVWSMMAGTEQGRKVRLYFLECEKIAKEKMITPSPTPVRNLPSSVEYLNAWKELKEMPKDKMTLLIEYRMMSELEIENVNQRFLTGNPEKQQHLTTVNIRAKQLGYTEKQIGDGKTLGSFVKKRVKPHAKDWQGQYQVWHYIVNDELDKVIHSYFQKETGLFN
jgi:phage anti-repressor protein